MRGKTWTADAPSNIALIKYMGKLDVPGNKSTNTSLSYTLPHLKSVVQLEYENYYSTDSWEPLTAFGGKKFEPLSLNERGLARFLSHLENLKSHFGFQGHFKIRSANAFPADCGLASSASSFAALTKVAMIALSELTGREKPTNIEAAEWSRRGSGSSCRSFFEPWAIWTANRVSEVPELADIDDLIHQVIVVNDKVKAVSSSDAHSRVTSSLLFAGRPERADVRAFDLIKALSEDQWDEAFEICWTEFWDMHALFETSQPSFGYMTPESLEVLRFIREDIWMKEGNGPLVTMDAGPNVHLLYRSDEKGLKLSNRVVKHFFGKHRIFTSEM